MASAKTASPVAWSWAAAEVVSPPRRTLWVSHLLHSGRSANSMLGALTEQLLALTRRQSLAEQPPCFTVVRKAQPHESLYV